MCRRHRSGVWTRKVFPPQRSSRAPTLAAMAKAWSKTDGSDEATVFTIEPEGHGVPIFLVAPGMEVEALSQQFWEAAGFWNPCPQSRTPERDVSTREIT